MKNLISRLIMAVIIAYLCLSIAGCKKITDDLRLPNTEYFVRFKQDGVKKELRLPDSAYFYHAFTGITSFGAGGVDANLNVISIGINDFTGSPIQVGKTYQNTKSGDLIAIQAFITWGNSFGDSFNSAILPETGNESAEITLTEITDQFVKGTFKGKLLDGNSSSSRVKYVITDGEFYLPRSNSPIQFTATNPGNGFIQGGIDGKTITIKEAENGNPFNQVWARYASEVSDGRTIYKLFINGNNNPSLPGYNKILLAFLSEKPFTTGQYDYFDDSVNPSFNLFTGGVQLVNAQNKLVTYSAVLFDSSTHVTLKITKFSSKSGEYIEGEFTALNAFTLESLTDLFSLTNGKFRAKLL